MKRSGFKPRTCAISPGTAKLSVKPRICKNRACRNKFTPSERHPFAIACCTGCEIILAKQHLAKVQAGRAKAERKVDKARREAIKTIPQLKAEVKTVCHAYVRYRDKDLPCICCDKFNVDSYLTGGEWDAGHYRSVGSADHLRFDERNIHRQLKHCNRDKAGRAVEYRQGLIARYGVEYVEALESNNAVIKWTREGLIALKAHYKAKLKELQANEGVAA